MAVFIPGALQPRYFPAKLGGSQKKSASSRRNWGQCRAGNLEPPAHRFPPPEPGETEESLDRKNLQYLWDRGWAPWEEIHPPENEFALKSLGKRGDNPLLPPEMEKLLFETPPLPPKVHVEPDHSYRDEVQTYCLIPPRDWPPPGWKVDPKELEFIRETHTMYANSRRREVDVENPRTMSEARLERWNTFIKQYEEWAAANRDKLDKEALEADPHYEPGRRRTGENCWSEDMYELPFIYPGQHYRGIVSHIDLYDGAFIFFGAVHDGWVSIEDNDWYKLRHVIKVGDPVVVEILARRDPYRYRFPIECRFVDPNVDKDIFWRVKHPPIISRPRDRNLEELARETGRPYLKKLTPDHDPATDPRCLCHPYIFKVWQLYAAEQLRLQEEEVQEIGEENVVYGPSFLKATERKWNEYLNQATEERNKEEEETSSSSEDEDEDEEARKARKKEPTGIVKVLPPTDSVPFLSYVVNVDNAELDMDAARAEKQELLKLKQLADAKGEPFVLPMSRREVQMATLESWHKRRCWEEVQALTRDVACRLQAGLPIADERYSDDPWPENMYNPKKKIWQAPYKRDPKEAKYAKFKRETNRAMRSTARRKAAIAAAANAKAAESKEKSVSSSENPPL